MRLGSAGVRRRGRGGEPLASVHATPSGCVFQVRWEEEKRVYLLGAPSASCDQPLAANTQRQNMQTRKVHGDEVEM